MKKTLFLFFATVSVVLMFFSCQTIKDEDVIVPATSKIVFVVPAEGKEDYLVLAADTDHDNLPDIYLRVADWPAIVRVCLLKRAYPDKDIRIKVKSISPWQKNSLRNLTAKTADAAEKTIFIN